MESSMEGEFIRGLMALRGNVFGRMGRKFKWFECCYSNL